MMTKKHVGGEVFQREVHEEVTPIEVYEDVIPMEVREEVITMEVLLMWGYNKVMRCRRIRLGRRI